MRLTSFHGPMTRSAFILMLLTLATTTAITSTEETVLTGDSESTTQPPTTTATTTATTSTEETVLTSDSESTTQPPTTTATTSTVDASSTAGADVTETHSESVSTNMTSTETSTEPASTVESTQHQETSKTITEVILITDTPFPITSTGATSTSSTTDAGPDQTTTSSTDLTSTATMPTSTSSPTPDETSVGTSPLPSTTTTLLSSTTPSPLMTTTPTLTTTTPTPTTPTYTWFTTPIGTTSTYPGSSTTFTTTTPRTTTSPSTTRAPEVRGTLRPSFGPIAGGTNVNLTLDVNAPPGIYTVNFEHPRNGAVNYFISGNVTGLRQLSFVTLEVDEKDIDNNWNVLIILNGTNYATNSLRFSYRGNPGVGGITPANQSILGGTRMTVSGTNLNAVAFPVVHALVRIFRPNPQTPSNPNITMAPDTPEECSVNETVSERMICPMPNLNLPETFIAYLTQGENNKVRRKRRYVASIQKILSRRKRDGLLLANLTGPNNSYAEVRLAFVFDSFSKYENGTILAVPLSLKVPIKIQRGPELISLDPRKEHLRIQGQDLTRLGSQEDYTVTIGVGNCTVTNLTTNLLSCRPPETIPSRGINDSLICSKSDSRQVLVSFAGEIPYYYTCVVYVHPNNNAKLIVGLTVGLASLMVILVVTIYIVHRRRRSRLKSKDKTTSRSAEPTSTSTAAKAWETGHHAGDRQGTREDLSEDIVGIPDKDAGPLTQNRYSYSSIQTPVIIPRAHTPGRKYQYQDRVLKHSSEYSTNFSHIQPRLSSQNDYSKSFVAFGNSKDNDYSKNFGPFQNRGYDNGEIPPADYPRDISAEDYNREIHTVDQDRNVRWAEYDQDIPPADYDEDIVDLKMVKLKRNSYLQLI